MKNKIVHINSSSSGGAFSFVKLLHNNLRDIGFESFVLTRFYKNKPENIFKYSIIGNVSLSRFFKKMFNPKSLKRDEKFEIFTAPLKKSTVLSKKYVKDADIIHLHWVSDLLSVDEIAEMTKIRKVFWTLHDMNPFTGGCHHSDDCEQFLSGCNNCPQLENGGKVSRYFEMKRKGFEKIDNDALTIISPSKWMFEKVSKSVLLKRFRHVLIPHFVDTETFKYQKMEEVRKKLSLDSDKKIFLYVSSVLENNRKGWDKVLEFIRKSKNRDDILFVIIGFLKNPELYDDLKNVKCVGKTDSSQMMANYYSASDYLINLTVAESFGLTTVESLCCGTPVVCYDIPIMKEHIKDGINGVFVKKDFSEIQSLPILERKEISDNARETYGIKCFNKYLDLYKQ